MKTTVKDVIVIGGGLHGLSAGLHLAREGQRVVILEQSWVGRHASGASAAGVRTLNRALEELPIAYEAMEMWHHMEAMVGDNCGFHGDGQIKVAERQSDMAVLEKRLKETRDAGYMHEELIDQAELRHLVPGIAKHCVAGLIARRDGAADPHRTLKAFRKSAEAADVTIHEECGVTAIERVGADWSVSAGGQQFIAPNIINTAGAWAGKIAAMIGDDISLDHKALLLIVTERIAPFIKPVVSVAGRPLSFKQTTQGTLVIGGSLRGRADIEAQKTFVDFNVFAKSAQVVTDLFPSVGPLHVVRTWGGIEAHTDDYLPVIGPSVNAPGVFHAFGFSGHGFQLVPVVGAILADLIIRGKTNRQIDSFAVSRILI
jgi:sarcosine oxidase subunit beta